MRHLSSGQALIDGDKPGLAILITTSVDLEIKQWFSKESSPNLALQVHGGYEMLAQTEPEEWEYIVFNHTLPSIIDQ